MSAALTAARRSPYRRQTPSVWKAAAQSVWAALELAGQRRAARELELVARRWETVDPELARALRAAGTPE